MKKDILKKATLIILFLLSIVYSMVAVRLKLGTAGNPGSGFMPFLLGIFLGGVSLMAFLNCLRHVSQNGYLGMDEVSFSLNRLRKQIMVCGAIAFYALVLPKLGFLITTSLFMLFLFKGIEPQKWSTAVIATILTVAFSFFVFMVWLKVQVPEIL